MKIIQNNFNNDNDREYICEHCNSIFEYDNEDIKYNPDGERIVRCPCCDRLCYIGEEDDNKNIKFPKDFHNSKNGVDINDERINEWIEKCVNYLKNDSECENGGFSYIGSGNTLVIVFNHADDNKYYCVVTQNYFDGYIDK